MKSQKYLDILAQISHDMKSPLSVIKIFMEMIESSTLDSDMREFCDAARRSVERLLSMTESLKNSIVTDHPRRMTYDVAEITRLCIGETRNLADESNVELRYVGPRKLLGMIDKVLFERVLTNMLSNALQSLNNKDCGWILVTLFSRNGAIFLDVADNGIGIEPTHLERIFDPDFTYGDHKGTGIGLHTCKKLIEHHNGRIEVHSVKSGGTVFTTILPGAASFVDDDANADPYDIVVENKDSAIIRLDETLDPIS